ncbi:Gag-pol fusion protein [Phytophthora palmivora]|uniref:Gag-pol fusion protein n=1 Tax=Phytophthora palmivora TaxID=4796 RepID=A0A2P4WZG8_9STRA|nr:Gag-pol fusion protein [Phytophthora palmivora]
MGHVDGLSRFHQTAICALTMSVLINDAGEDPSTVLVGEERPTSSHGPTKQLSVTPVNMFGLDQERFVREQRQTPWIMALIAFLESAALALVAQLRAKILMRRVHLKARAAHARTIEVPVIPLPFIAIVLHHCHADARQVTRVSLKQETELRDLRTGTDGSEMSTNTSESVALTVVERAIALGKMDSCNECPFKARPLVITPRGNMFILVFADYVTRWVEAFPTKRLDTVSVVETMVNEVISRHGVPERLLSDQGSNFISELARSFYETLDILKLFGAAYHPQTQGLVERFNGTLIRMLKMFVNVAQDDCELYLPRGQDPIHPLDLAFLNTNLEWKSNEMAAYRRRLYSSLRETQRLVEMQLLKAQGRHEQLLEDQVSVELEEGDPVWMYQYFRARRGEKKT